MGMEHVRYGHFRESSLVFRNWTKNCLLAAAILPLPKRNSSFLSLEKTIRLDNGSWDHHVRPGVSCSLNCLIPKRTGLLDYFARGSYCVLFVFCCSYNRWDDDWPPSPSRTSIFHASKHTPVIRRHHQWHPQWKETWQMTRSRRQRQSCRSVMWLGDLQEILMVRGDESNDLN